MAYKQVNIMGSLPDPLAGGFYTVSEAARLLGSTSSQRIARWLSSSDPLIMRQYEKLGPRHELGFLDLLEIRFFEHFRKHISLQSLRVAARHARQELKVDHPFATNVKFQSDRKRIFMETAKETGDKQLLDLVSNQFAIYKVIEDSIARDLTFDPSGLASQWRPRQDLTSVVINPKYAFGRPVVSASHVPTAAVFNLFKAEQDIKIAADWFGLTEGEADQSIRFEIGLGA